MPPANDPLFTLPPAPDELAEAREREQREREQRDALRAKAGAAWRVVPPRYRTLPGELLKRLEHERAQPAGRRLLGKVRDAHTLAALLMGPTGCGKSTSAALLVHRALAEFEQSRGERCAAVVGLVWVRATRLGVAERQHSLGAGEADVLTSAKRAGLLVLDDLGLEEPGAVLPVLAHRYDEGLPTIVTTGLTRGGLTKHLAAAGVRLVTEQSGPTPFLLADAHDPPRARPVNP